MDKKDEAAPCWDWVCAWSLPHQLSPGARCARCAEEVGGFSMERFTWSGSSETSLLRGGTGMGGGVGEEKMET